MKVSCLALKHPAGNMRWSGGWACALKTTNCRYVCTCLRVAHSVRTDHYTDQQRYLASARALSVYIPDVPLITDISCSLSSLEEVWHCHYFARALIRNSRTGFWGRYLGLRGKRKQEWRRLLKNKLSDAYSASNIICVVKPRRVKLVGYMARKEGVR